MNSKNKSIILGVLLAIVFIMAIAYATFATTLNITGSANTNASWDVHFNKAAYNQTTDITATKTFSGGSLPTGTLVYGESSAPLTATVTANLNQPGDQVVFTLRIINAGSIRATAASPTITGTDFSISGNTATNDRIRFIVSNPQVNPLNAGGTTTMTVTAQYIDSISGSCSVPGNTTKDDCENEDGVWTESALGQGTTGNVGTQTGTITVGLEYTQS